MAKFSDALSLVARDGEKSADGLEFRLPSKSRETLFPAQSDSDTSLAEALAEVETPVGRQRVQAVLAARPFPHFEDAPDQPGWSMRIEQDGRRTVGQFVGRQFVERPSGGI